jgi:hypothetical protein
MLSEAKRGDFKFIDEKFLTKNNQFNNLINIEVLKKEL